MALAAAPEVPGFRALSPLGYGPASTLYSAQSDALGRWVALTVYSTSLHDERTQRRFTRSFETARRLGSHPNAVTLLESGLTLDRRPYVASEIYDRGTLDGRIAGRKGLTVDEALHMGICLAGALETAHRADVIHGGVHPARVLIGHDGEPALADLGLVPLVERGGLAALIGPMSYHAAPEVLEGEAVTAATDVYSLASTLYAGLCCRAPYRGADEDDTVASLLLRILQHAVPSMDRPDVPPFLEQVLHQALSCEAKERPERPLVLAKALQTCQSHLGLPMTEPVVLDIAANLRLASGDGITGATDTNGYGATTPMSTNGHGAAGHGGSPSEPGAPVRRVFVPYPAEQPAAANPEPPPGAGPAPTTPAPFPPPAQGARQPLDEPALREAGFPEPPPLTGPAAEDAGLTLPPPPPPADSDRDPWEGLYLDEGPSVAPQAPEVPPALVGRSVPPAPAPPAPAPVPAPAPAPLVPDHIAPSGTSIGVSAEAEPDYSAAAGTAWADLHHDAPDEDPWADLQLDPAVLAGQRPGYDIGDDHQADDPRVGRERPRPEARQATRADDDEPPSAAGPRALPVIVLMALVAVLIAGVSWMIVTGEDPAPSDRADAPSTSRAIEGGQGTANFEVTAAENAAGVQLDWEESGQGNQVVVVLSETEPPQALPADAGTALLVPAARLQPQAGYCFAVVASDVQVVGPAELAAAVPDEVLAPSACIRGATAATVRRA